jgi:hypothetical protein
VKLYREGDSSKAICSHCGQLRPITFAERDVPLSSGKGVVRDVLVGVCKVCDEVVSIPQQSVPRIKESVHYSRHPLEARIPRHLLDALGLACHELGFGAESSALLFRYYLRRAGTKTRLRTRLPALAASDEAMGPANARFSAKLNDTLFTLLQEIERDGIKQSDVVKALIVQIKKDILDDKREDVRKDLQNLMLLAG